MVKSFRNYLFHVPRSAWTGLFGSSWGCPTPYRVWDEMSSVSVPNGSMLAAQRMFPLRDDASCGNYVLVGLVQYGKDMGSDRLEVLCDVPHIIKAIKHGNPDRFGTVQYVEVQNA
jgi:hypothetical protein